ncbi:MAG: N-acetylmuramoyl-L-alanine amidase [Candidatus Andeanibacterium colombiense]|uniref:N-acetylmuramoyl-L-alanine amidase n=1 Tax=Candidatus Andeanibacterium colombiense TaxID=3121345 RepID=A0AAJ5X6L1_9SPHN|nr:MAG: N-acetylmuramoyl-L-alanine amidase [Sphingomonadaceae bacterium]
MRERLQVLLLFLFPVVLMAGLYALKLKLPVPVLGRDYVIRIELPDPGRQIGLPEVLGPPDASRPLVVIDAGHGGHDPGANGGGIEEKRLVLGLALALRDRLLLQGGIRVALTRSDDSFLVLQERAEIARRLGADLFLSIHADSAGDESGVQGASVYTLSEQASDEAAARFAARENDADKVNGISLAGRSDAVSAILVGLSQRHAQEESSEFAGLITREGQGSIVFHPDPRRSAALAVLRAPDVPGVLFEAGFITNPDDAKRLTSPEGKARFADALERAIRIFFARNSGALAQ